MTSTSPARIAAEELPAALQPILRQRIPGAGAATIVSWAPSAQGFSTETYLLDLEGVDPAVHQGDSSIGLVFRRPPEFAVLPDYDLRRQYLVMDRLRDSQVPVPRVRYIDADGTSLGTPYFVMDRVEDVVTVCDMPPYHRSGVFAETDDGGRASLWNGCVDLVAAVHRVSLQDNRFRFCDLRRFGSTPPQRLAGFLRYAITWATGDAPVHPKLAEALDWLDAHLYTPSAVTLVWGDSRMSNVLYRKDSLSPVCALDWEIAYLGDPAADLAWMFATDWISSPFPERAPAPGTPTREETIARYEDLTKRALTDMRFSDVSAALLLAVPLIRLNRKFALEGVDLADVCAQRIDYVLQGD